MRKTQRHLLLRLLPVAMLLHLGCDDRVSLKVPPSASYSRDVYQEAGFLDMDGYILKVFTLGTEDLLSWKKGVESYTAKSWEKCPADSQIMEFLPSGPPEMFKPSGGTSIIKHLNEQDSAEYFYISESGECWWYASW